MALIFFVGVLFVHVMFPVCDLCVLGLSLKASSMEVEHLFVFFVALAIELAAETGTH